MFKVNVSNILDNNKSQENFSFSILNLSRNIDLLGPLSVSGKAIVRGSSVIVYFRIKGNERVTCDKCLDFFECDIDREFSQEYVQNDLDDSDNLEGLAGFLVDDKGNIDLEKAIIEEISINDLNLNLCSDSCKGLCPKCGLNLNKNKCSCYNNKEGDNPFAKLSKLKEK